MAGGLNYVSIAPEDNYGVAPATGWRGLKAQDDGHKVNVLTLDDNAIIYGQEGPTSSVRRSIERNALGGLKCDMVSNGLGILLRAAFGSAVLSTPEDATAARQMLFTTTGAASTYSIATQVQREFTGGTADRDTYVGGQVKELRIMQAVAASGGGVSSDAKAKIEFDMEYQRRQPGVAQHLPTYPTSDIDYSVGECTLEIGPEGAPLQKCLNKFDFKLPTGITDSPCIGASLVQEEQTRGEMPAPTLALAWDYATRDYYDAYLAGTIMSFRATWTPSGTAFEIETGINPSFVLDIPAFQLTGDTPSMSRGAKTSQDLPGDILWNTVDPMVSLTVITSDTAF